MDRHRSRLHLHLLPLAGEVIGALAVDQDRAIGRRRLLDGAGEARQDGFQLRQRRAHLAFRDDLPLQIERIGLRAEGDGEVVNLVAVEHPAGELGRLADRDRQHPGRQRIERAAMADLPFLRAAQNLALGPQRALHCADRLGRAKAMGFVEDDPAVHGGALYSAYPALSALIAAQRPFVPPISHFPLPRAALFRAP